MQTVKVEKAALISILKRNWNEHVDTYRKALRAYRAKVLRELEKAVAKARLGKSPELSSFLFMQEPVSYESEYKLAVGMLEMSVEPEITLTQQEYSQFVNDDWQWKGDFLSNSASYGVGKAAPKRQRARALRRR